MEQYPAIASSIELSTTIDQCATPILVDPIYIPVASTAKPLRTWILMPCSFAHRLSH